MKPLNIWTNQHFNEQNLQLLRTQAEPHCILTSSVTSKSNLVASGRDHQTQQADILYGQPSVDDVLQSPSVKWVQLTTAGYTRFDKPEILSQIKNKGQILCNASALYDEPCAQHILAMLMSLARAIPQAAVDQTTAKWDFLALRSKSFILKNQRVAIVGYGAIARRLVEMLAPFHLHITAFRRSPRGDENCPTLPIDQLDESLPQTDIVINILPLSDSTRHFFDASRIAKIKPGAIYINIGRGDTNDQLALVSALNELKLSKVFVDVTAPEPLPADHPLWTTPNAHITPHTAGGTHDEALQMINHFINNLRRYEKGEPLVDRIV